MWYSPQICLAGDDVNVITRQLAQKIMDHGVMYQSSDLSMNRGRMIKEVWNSSVCLTNPRKRILRSQQSPIFNPGLAAARFMYMLSGSNLLDPIAFYTGKVRQFSDDGKTIPGSSYGRRIFGRGSRENQFEATAQLIATRPNTKRATITIYSTRDLERIDSCDIPCATSITFMPRENILHMTVFMRANDVVKLMPYNIFEFSLLQECMASRVGMEMGSYWHISVSSHLRGTSFSSIPLFVEEGWLSRRMGKVPSFSERERKLLIGEENRIRKGVSSIPTMQNFLKKAWNEFHPVWADILSTLACEALYVRTRKRSSIEQEIERIMSQKEKQSVLLASYKDFLSLREE